MPTSMQKQTEFLERQYHLFMPRLNHEERLALDEVYSIEFDRLSEICATPTTQGEQEAILLDLHTKAREEQYRTLDAWIEGKLTPFRVMVVSQQPIEAVWLKEALRRSGWDQFDVQILKPVTPFEIEEDLLKTLHGLIVFTQGDMRPRLDRLTQMAVELGLRIFTLDLRRAKIRRKRVRRARPKPTN